MSSIFVRKNLPFLRSVWWTVFAPLWTSRWKVRTSFGHMYTLCSFYYHRWYKYTRSLHVVLNCLDIFLYMYSFYSTFPFPPSAPFLSLPHNLSLHSLPPLLIPPSPHRTRWCDLLPNCSKPCHRHSRLLHPLWNRLKQVREAESELYRGTEWGARVREREKEKERERENGTFGVTEEECVIRSLGWMQFVIAGNWSLFMLLGCVEWIFNYCSVCECLGCVQSCHVYF